jgi:hypothetical protein
MRRRIYIAPDGSGLEDVTARPYRYGLHRDDVNGTLYDDEIWRAYLAAKSLLQDLERVVIGHLRDEPYDEIELRAAEEAEALMDGAESSTVGERVARMESLAKLLVDHAEDQHGDGGPR